MNEPGTALPPGPPPPRAKTETIEPEIRKERYQAVTKLIMAVATTLGLLGTVISAMALRKSDRAEDKAAQAPAAAQSAAQSAQAAQSAARTATATAQTANETARDANQTAQAAQAESAAGFQAVREKLEPTADVAEAVADRCVTRAEFQALQRRINQLPLSSLVPSSPIPARPVPVPEAVRKDLPPTTSAAAAEQAQP